MSQAKNPGSELPLQQQEEVVIRFAGDSGDGMQITGNQFTHTSAIIGNDLATFPDYPAEIRAPAGTRPGVSGFQVRFGSSDIHTPGDQPDVLVAMNPAALIVNIKDLRPGGVVVVNTGQFGDSDLRIRRESMSTPWLVDAVWSAARRVGHGQTFSSELTTVDDDHVPFLRAGVPAVDIIDLDNATWHTAQDDLAHVSRQSLQIVGDVVLAALPEIQQRLASQPR